MSNRFLDICNKILSRTKSLAKQNRHRLVGRSDRWEEKRNFQISFLKAMALKQNDAFVDIGCGTLRGGIPIIDFLEEGLYTGIDIREEAISEAKDELREAGLTHKKPMLLVTDSLHTVELKDPASVMWSFSVFIHMDEDKFLQSLTFIKNNLASNGRVFCNLNIGESWETKKWREFPVVCHPFNYYEELVERFGLTLKDLGPPSDYGHKTLEFERNQRMMVISQQN